MTATATQHREDAGRTSQIPVVFTLGRFEGRQMVRHLLFWLGVLAAVGLSIFELIEESPVLNRVSMTLAWTVAPIAVAVAFLAGWAVLRARGRTDAHPPTVMPAPMSRRVAGVLVGLAWPAVATLAVQLALLGWTLFRDPVTSLVWSELLVGPAFVVLAGALSAAVTRWIPHPSTPLVALLVLAGIHIVVPYNPGNWGSQIGPAALAPIAWPETIIPYEVAFRPSGLHLAYLIGPILALTGVATLGRAKSSWLLLGVGLASAGFLGPAQLGPIEESQRVEAMSLLVGDEADLACETHDAVTYCAMPGYQGWIDDWRRLAEPVLDAAPAGAKAGLEVRQYPVHNTFLLDGSAFNGWWWIRPAYDDFAERNVVPVGSVLNLTWGYQEVVSHITNHLVGCGWPGCRGEARDILNLWLAIHSPGVASYTVDDPSFGNEYGNVTECMVRDLWGQPGITELIHANWANLTDPETTYQEAGGILGVAVPQGASPDEQLEGGCP